MTVVGVARVQLWFELLLIQPLPTCKIADVKTFNPICPDDLCGIELPGADIYLAYVLYSSKYHKQSR